MKVLFWEKKIKDALKRAEAYSKAGADAILVHSKEKNPSQIFSFTKKFKKSKFFKPLVAVPSSYSKTYEKDLIKWIQCCNICQSNAKSFLPGYGKCSQINIKK